PSAGARSAATLQPVFPFVQIGSGGLMSGEMGLNWRGALSDQIILYVRSDTQSYWRGFTFDHYERNTWRSSATRTRFRPRVPAVAGGGVYIQTFYYVAPQPQALLAGYWPERVYFNQGELEVYRDDAGGFQASGPLGPGARYAVRSL